MPLMPLGVSSRAILFSMQAKMAALPSGYTLIIIMINIMGFLSWLLAS